MNIYSCLVCDFKAIAYKYLAIHLARYPECYRRIEPCRICKVQVVGTNVCASCRFDIAVAIAKSELALPKASAVCLIK